MKLTYGSNWQTKVKNTLQHTAVVAAIAGGIAVSHQAPAAAQAAYGSYIGGGVGFGLTSGDGEDNRVSPVIAFRYKFLRAPLSLRTQALIGNGITVVPTLSYDLPLNWQTDLYLGAGASVPIGGNAGLGTRTSFALQPGIDYALPHSDLVVFGNAIISFGGYSTGGAAASLQGGVGLRF